VALGRGFLKERCCALPRGTHYFFFFAAGFLAAGAFFFAAGAAFLAGAFFFATGIVISLTRYVSSEVRQKRINYNANLASGTAMLLPQDA
jgi:hypothetical protein